MAIVIALSAFHRNNYKRLSDIKEESGKPASTFIIRSSTARTIPPWRKTKHHTSENRETDATIKNAEY